MAVDERMKNLTKQRNQKSDMNRAENEIERNKKKVEKKSFHNENKERKQKKIVFFYAYTSGKEF